MNGDEVQARLKDVFAMVFNDPEFELKPDLQMGEIEAWDSFNHINLMIGIESEFGIEFDSDELGHLLTVGQILAAVEGRLLAAGK